MMVRFSSGARSQHPFVILSLVKCTLITMGQCTYVVFTNIHANSSSKSSLFLTEICTRFMDLLKMP
ncbi:hypothetical protein ACSBR1_026637 [Camellia fascicularis]